MIQRFFSMGQILPHLQKDCGEGGKEGLLHRFES